MFWVFRLLAWKSSSLNPLLRQMNKMLVASSLTLLMVTFMYNKVLTMVVVDSNLMTVICVFEMYRDVPVNLE